jgi:formylglycine-generating enzyme required for sulfatase activity
LAAERAEKQREEQLKLEAKRLDAKRAEAEEKQNLVAARLATLNITAGTVKVNPKDGQKYVWIPSGAFQMGCSAGDSGCGEDEKPPRFIKIERGFWLGQTPVTQAAYLQVIGVNPSRFQGEHLPVEKVSWDEARAYCEAVGGRLPSEAEWEYAARAGNGSSRYGNLDDIAWYDKNSGKMTHAVGLKKPNQWNLYDMLGNVWEWVADRYDEDYYKISPSVNPTGPRSGQHFVLRGGSWINGSNIIRSSIRYSLVAQNWFYNVGFRCALDIIP